MGKVVEIDCEKPMKLETSPKVTKSKRSLHWCRSISKKYLCRFYYSISQKVITLSGRRFITVSGVLLHYRAVITLSGVFLLHYRTRITVSGVYYIIGWYNTFLTFPNTGTVGDYDAAVTAPLNANFIPKVNPAYARHSFRQMTQRPGETVRQFVTRMRIR